MTFVIATHNDNKVKEFRRILEPLGIEAATAETLGMTLTEAEETGTTFAENARIKAALACRETGLPAIADDSGLCVDELDGAPGIYSARFAAPGHHREKLLAALDGVPDEFRGAHYTAAVCCVFPNGDVLTAEGRCYGRIGHESRGTNGFGYDPIFLHADGRTYAELSDEEKDAISHRGIALRKFSEKLIAYLQRKEETV